MTQRLEILRLGHRGDGVAAGPVYAPLTLPGETVEGEVTGERMAAPAILTASPHRVSPPCRHFGDCGGCLLQHASGAFLAGWKRERVAEALAAAGVMAGEIRPTVSSPPGARRRAVFSARRTKKTAQIGFHARAEHRIAPIAECPLIAPALLAALEPLRALTSLTASRKGEVKIAATVTETGLDIDLRDAKPVEPADRAAHLARLVALAAEADFARLSVDGEIVAERRPPTLRMGRARVVPPPGAFLQATADGEAALVAAVREAVGDAGRVADLFAGCGTFALPLAETAEVWAVEGDAAMLAALDAGWRGAAGALKRIRSEIRDLFRRPLEPLELRKTDALVFDPPRAGAAAQCERLAAAEIPRLAAVSCEPATFARDARTLTDGGYSLDWVQPVDQFLWSPHVELAAQFTRA
jgi:23S rRNA (uracil1939-C5)-methyltransferase